MSARQTRRFFIVAFLLSLLVHAIAVHFVQWRFEPSGEEAPTVVHNTHLRVIHLAHVQPPPPAPPTPPPPSAAPSAAPRRTAPRRASANGVLPAAVPSASAGPVAAPSPSVHPSPTPDCSKNDTPVLIAATAPPPDLPAATRASSSQQATTATIRVVVAPDGSIAQATIAQSTGVPALDDVAVRMARVTKYTAATHACKPVASTYAYTVEFAPL